MGTDSDQASFIRASFLVHETVDGESSLGFYRSKEGREFLRRLFKPYLRRQNMGEGKVATIIADGHANPDTQDREVDRTKSALRRWSKDGQSEIWPKEPEKNLRCLRRLENEYLSVQELREIMEDTAETIQKHQAGIAFSHFFYGALPVDQTDPEVKSIQQEFEGIYEANVLVQEPAQDGFEHIKKEIAEELAKEVRKHGLAPNVIQIDPGRFNFDDAIIDTRETPGFVISPSHPTRFVRLVCVPNRNFMLVQEFRKDYKKDEFDRPRLMSIGYAFPLRDRTLHLMLTEAGPPLCRQYASFSPNAVARNKSKLPKDGDLRWRASRHPFAKEWQATNNELRMEFWEKIPENDKYERGVHKLIPQLDLTLWNLVP